MAADAAKSNYILILTRGPLNGLDLIVLAGGLERHGNMKTGACGACFDTVNNVEQVNLDNVPPGQVRIVVRASRITRYAQPWAYVWRLTW